MFTLSCQGCFAALPGAELVFRTIQEGLVHQGYKAVGALGQWGPAFMSALKQYQKAQGYAYTGGKPEYWSVQALLAPTVGGPAFWEWAAAYQQATGTKPVETVFNTQLALRRLSFDVGPIDGLMGPKTLAAIKSWQKTKGLLQTGQLDAAQLTVLTVEGVQPALAEAAAEEAASQAIAAGAPVIEVPDESVLQPKFIVIRDPATQAVVRVEKLVPIPKKLVPWMWIGLGTAAVLGIGGAIALVVRAKRKPEAPRMLPSATMGDAAMPRSMHIASAEVSLQKALDNVWRCDERSALPFAGCKVARFEIHKALREIDAVMWHAERGEESTSADELTRLEQARRLRAGHREPLSMGDPHVNLRTHKRDFKTYEENARAQWKAGNVEASAYWTRAAEGERRQMQWHRDHPKGY